MKLTTAVTRTEIILEKFSFQTISMEILQNDIGFLENFTALPPRAEFSSNATAPPDGLSKFFVFMENNIWVSVKV